jgi:DNA repair protein RadC
MTPLKHLPLLNRPRERLQRDGAECLQLEDLIAVLLRTGSKHADVLEVSRLVASQLVSGHGNLHELASIPGVGLAKASVISAALKLPGSLLQRTNAFQLSDPEKVYAACADLIAESQEHLVVFYLTVRNQQIARHTVTIGTATASLVHAREVFRPAIAHNASHIVLAHNHPSGDPAPSSADREVTLAIAQAGKHIGIQLADHVVCAASGYVSMRSDFPELFF